MCARGRLVVATLELAKADIVDDQQAVLDKQPLQQLVTETSKQQDGGQVCYRDQSAAGSC